MVRRFAEGRQESATLRDSMFNWQQAKIETPYQETMTL
jgi:hypothetical protein